MSTGTWLQQQERGTDLGIRTLLWTTRLFGREGGRLLLRPIALYYALFGGAVGRASREYLSRLYEDPGPRRVYRHVLTFAECALDRVFHASGQTAPFDIGRHGSQHLARLRRERRGALLLGAHLGSFEVLRAMGRDEGLPVNILAHFRNARRITAFLKAVAPDFAGRVIEIDPDAPHFILAVRERIESGELVAVLGDRTGLGEASTEVRFLGGPARFPSGPFTMAAALRCPVYLTFGLYHPPRRYMLYCEPFAERVELTRGRREEEVRAYVQRYARRLEHYCRLAPMNWFNFFPFWSEPS